MKKSYLIVQVMTVMFITTNIQGQNGIEQLRQRAALYEPMIVASATRNGLDPYLLWTIAYLESRFRPDAISYKNGQPCAFGLMQFTPRTARRYGLTNPHNPREAINAAGRYVRELMMRFDGRIDLVLAAYNAGEATVEAFLSGKKLQVNRKIINPGAIRTGGIPPYAETKKYVAQGVLLYRSIARQVPSLSLSHSSRMTNDLSTNTDSIYVSNFPLIRSRKNPMKAPLSVYAQ